VTRIIVLDDERNIRTMVRVILDDAGFEVVEAVDATSAIRAVRESGADLVISDLFMPDVDGLEVIHTLRREHSSLKIIAMSGGGFGGTIDLLEIARRMGADEVVHKPFSPQHFVDVVRRALGFSGDRPA
jgi:DNA-binding response OmpR family regulator